MFWMSIIPNDFRIICSLTCTYFNHISLGWQAATSHGHDFAFLIPRLAASSSCFGRSWYGPGSAFMMLRMRMVMVNMIWCGWYSLVGELWHRFFPNIWDGWPCEMLSIGAGMCKLPTQFSLANLVFCLLDHHSLFTSLSLYQKLQLIELFICSNSWSSSLSASVLRSWGYGRVGAVRSTGTAPRHACNVCSRGNQVD